MSVWFLFIGDRQDIVINSCVNVLSSDLQDSDHFGAPNRSRVYTPDTTMSWNPTIRSSDPHSRPHFASTSAFRASHGGQYPNRSSLDRDEINTNNFGMEYTPNTSSSYASAGRSCGPSASIFHSSHGDEEVQPARCDAFSPPTRAHAFTSSSSGNRVIQNAITPELNNTRSFISSTAYSCEPRYGSTRMNSSRSSSHKKRRFWTESEKQW